MLKAYGIRVKPNMTEVQGRILPLPQLSFGRGSQSPVMNGEWQSRGAVFKQVFPFYNRSDVQGATLKNWGILIFARRNEVDRDLDVFIKTLCQTAHDKGMTIVNRDPMKQFADMNWSGDEIIRRLQQDIMPAFNRRGTIELLFVVSPAKSSQMYIPVKRYCDTVAGIASQCTNKFNVRRKAQDRSFAFNMLMKINSKLGGVNVSIREMPLALKTGTVIMSPSEFNLTISGLFGRGCHASFSQFPHHCRKPCHDDWKYRPPCLSIRRRCIQPDAPCGSYCRYGEYGKVPTC